MKKNNDDGVIIVISIILLALVLNATSTTTNMPNLPSNSVKGLGAFVSTSGIQILDGNGKDVLLRGLNYFGYECANKDNELHIEADYARFASIGFNVVRLPVGWMWFEPQPGFFDSSYLNLVNKDVQWAKKYGLYIILDMHQSRWAAKFLDGNGNHGCGAPDWTVTQYPPTAAGMQMAMTNFWTNETLQGHYVDVWRKIATTYDDEPAVAGYDIMNEPDANNGNYVDSHYGYVESLYLKVIQSIRSVDSRHVIFLEPLNHNNKMLSEFPLRNQVVWSPHFYPLAGQSHYFPQNITKLREEFALDYNEVVLGIKMPMWIGEYNAFMSDASYLNWLQDAIGLFNQYHVGSAWWPYEGGPIRQIPAPVVNQFNSSS